MLAWWSSALSDPFILFSLRKKPLMFNISGFILQTSHFRVVNFQLISENRRNFLEGEFAVRKFLALVLLYFMRFALWFRYRVTIKGLDQLNPDVLNKPGGVLFLPNHPTFLSIRLWSHWQFGRNIPIRPVIVEYMYYMPLIHTIMRFMNALPIPNFVTSSNSLKKKRADKVIETMIEDLKNKENFLIYPAGKTKHQATRSHWSLWCSSHYSICS